MMRRGFTLIELVVAVAVFSIAMALGYGGLNSLVRSREQLADSQAQLAQLQRCINAFETDLRSVLRRPVQDSQGRNQAALQIDREGVQISRGGYANALALPRAEIERVLWRWSANQWQRQRYAVLDPASGSRVQPSLQLDGIAAVEIEALGADGRWFAAWPQGRGNSQALPRAVRLRIDSARFGRIERLLELPAEPLPAGAP